MEGEQHETKTRVPPELALPHHLSDEWPKVCKIVTEYDSSSLKACLQTIYALESLMLWGVRERKSFKDLESRYYGLTDLFAKFSDKAKTQFLKHTFPFMLSLLTDLPTLFPRDVPILILLPGRPGNVTLSHLQCASLLACFFFSLHKEPRMSFVYWIQESSQSYRFKLQCILRYFELIRDGLTPKTSLFSKTGAETKAPARNISFVRNVVSPSDISELFDQEKLLQCTKPLTSFTISKLAADRIEAAANCLQVDFANKRIGGHVLGNGCVQEEIRFSISPECLVSMLLCPEMLATESVTVVGPLQAADYSGYGGNTCYKADFKDPATLDGSNRLRTVVVGIDAIEHPLMGLGTFRRELIKASAGFSLPRDVLGEEDEKFSEVATGNWGCGMFGGDPQTKAMIQWVAATLAGRSIRYFVFGERRMADLPAAIDSLKHLTVGQLWKLLTDYVTPKGDQPAPTVDLTFFDYQLALQTPSQ